MCGTSYLYLYVVPLEVWCGQWRNGIRQFPPPAFPAKAVKRKKLDFTQRRV